MAARTTQRVMPAPAAAEEQEPYPFAEGDVVTLQSGGFAMTVQACSRNLETGAFTVYVIWAVAGWKALDAFQSRHFPAKWLKKVDTTAKPAPAFDESDDMPF